MSKKRHTRAPYEVHTLEGMKKKTSPCSTYRFFYE
jgi:hypothetical protein